MGVLRPLHVRRQTPEQPQVTVDGATHLLSTEFVAARVGDAIGAPVFPMAVAEVAPELVAGLRYQRDDEEIAPGRAFGSFIRPDDDLVDADAAPPQWRQAPTNRARAASVCVLHALLKLGDSLQFVVRTVEPYEFWSIDNGYFISGGAPWSAALGLRGRHAEANLRCLFCFEAEVLTLAGAVCV
jgi:hypothetical protein